MEGWVIKEEKIIYELFFFLQTHFPSTPVFHHSNYERSELTCLNKLCNRSLFPFKGYAIASFCTALNFH